MLYDCINYNKGLSEQQVERYCYDISKEVSGCSLNDYCLRRKSWTGWNERYEKGKIRIFICGLSFALGTF